MDSSWLLASENSLSIGSYLIRDAQSDRVPLELFHADRMKEIPNINIVGKKEKLTHKFPNQCLHYGFLSSALT